MSLCSSSKHGSKMAAYIVDDMYNQSYYLCHDCMHDVLRSTQSIYQITCNHCYRSYIPPDFMVGCPCHLTDMTNDIESDIEADIERIEDEWEIEETDEDEDEDEPFERKL